MFWQNFFVQCVSHCTTTPLVCLDMNIFRHNFFSANKDNISRCMKSCNLLSLLFTFHVSHPRSNTDFYRVLYNLNLVHSTYIFELHISLILTNNILAFYSISSDSNCDIRCRAQWLRGTASDS